MSAADPFRNHASMLGAMRGLSKLKNHGGKGQSGIGIIGGSVMTLRENAALKLAKDVVAEVEKDQKKGVAEISLVVLARAALGRSEGKPCTDDEIMQEVCRLQNHAIYGDGVARR